MKFIGVALVVILYVLLPVDFLPEIVLGPVGLLDDLAAIAIGTAIVLAD